MKKSIRISSELAGKVKLGILEFHGVHNREKDEQLWLALLELADQYRKTYPDFGSSKPILEPARILYKAVGMEPSRYRPASEALLKRILQKKPLYQISKLVDFGNFCSLKFMLPVGLYDYHKIHGDILVRLGKDGETYEGLGKPVVYLHDKLILQDREGPFGNPSSDSLRTSVSLDTKAILFIYFFPYSWADDRIESVIMETRQLAEQYIQPGEIDSKMIKDNE